MKNLLRIVRILIAVVLVGSGTLHAQATTPMAAQNPDLDAIWKYAGSWHIESESFDTPYSKTGKETSTLQNDCWRTEGYVACRQIVNGVSQILLVFTCRPDHNCTSYQIPTNGSTASNGSLRIDGNTWTFPWQITDKDGKTTYFHVVNVWTGAETIDFRQEYSTDQVHWTKTMTGHDVKVSSK